ncbi:MAG: hypothetical protein GEU77_20270 [Deltaproteobacteria bacterium]|nr:hypothetical protein [Deltaproteobacteria bacterium]
MEHNGSDKIRDFAAGVGDRASAAKEQASAATHRTAARVGDQMKTVAERIRETGPRIESAVHHTAQTIAERLERGGDYFRERQYEGLAGTAATYVRQHPMMSLIAGVATGLLLARKIRR